MDELKKIRDFLQQVTAAFAAVMDIEIGVISRDLEVIAGSGYFEKQVGVIYKEGCMTHRIISSDSEEPILVENTAHAVCCKECEYSTNCDVLAFLMSPITRDGAKLGTISLLALDELHRRKLINNSAKMQNFLNKLCNIMIISLNEKKMEAKVISLMNQFRDVINSVHEGIVAVNVEGMITNVNRAAEEMLDLGNDIPGRHISTLFPAFNIREAIEIHRAESENHYYLQETTYRSPADRDLILLYNITPKFEDGKLSGAVLSFQRKEEMQEMASRIVNEGKKNTFSGIIGASSEIMELKNRMTLIAATDSTVLIRGETGTGKSLFARAIHEESPRKKQPFVEISCAAIPAPLLESELFGYEEGAFTGARRGGKPGKLETADGGTIFLDEIGDMPLDFQVKLLHTIEEKKIARIGGINYRDIDVRIIAATNRNLEELIKQGRFREDLYYRINVIPFIIPRLSDRKDDILMLMHHFLDQYASRLKKELYGFREDARQVLLDYPWPGNVRELENAVEYAVSIEQGLRISRSSLPEKILRHFSDQEDSGLQELADLERKAIEAALQRYGYSTRGKEKAASALGISRATLYRKLKSMNIEVS